MCASSSSNQLSSLGVTNHTTNHTTNHLYYQIAGSYPDTMTKAAEVINKYADVDFVDINCGCPIDLLCAQGAGQALGEAKHKLRKIVMGMDRVLDCPVTVKIRKGKGTKNVVKVIGGVVGEEEEEEEEEEERSVCCCARCRCCRCL